MRKSAIIAFACAAGGLVGTARGGPALWPWRLMDTLHASDNAGGEFGSTIAISGDLLVVGAPASHYGESYAGAAYVLRKQGSAWAPETKLVASITGGEASARFGSTIAIGGPGLIVVGAPEGESGGHAYVFERIAGAWQRTADLTAPVPQMNARFAVSVAAQGDLIIVGHPYDNEFGARAGSARLYSRGPSGWQASGVLLPAGTQPQDAVGYSVAISGDWALVRRVARPGGGAQVYSFERVEGAWIERGTLQGTGSSQYSYGESLAIRGDLAVVGATFHNGAVLNQGGAFAFRRTGGQWSEEAALFHPQPHVGDFFGMSVGLADDTIIVGAPGRDGPASSSGAAYVFAYVAGAWTLQHTAPAVALPANSSMGRGVALDGTHALIGVPGTTTTGTVRIFGDDPPPCPGDANADNRIDFLDLNIVLSNFFVSGPSVPGDLNFDGGVNFLDLNIVLSYFGAACD